MGRLFPWQKQTENVNDPPNSNTLWALKADVVVRQRPLDDDAVTRVDADRVDTTSAEGNNSPDMTSRRLKGVILKYFDDKRYGFIKSEEPNSNDGDLFVHISNVEGRRKLYENEPVDFEISNTKGKLQAIKVNCENERVRGTVVKWLNDKRFGFISTNASSQEVFVHYTEIQAQGPRELLVGEEVEFFLIETEEKREQAIIVEVFESRQPFERFADISKFNSGQLADELAKLAQFEDWNYKKKQNNKTVPVLRNYILYTFARLIEEDKIISAQDKDGRPVACGNTGLVTGLQEEIFAFFTEAPKSDVAWQLSAFVVESDRRLTCFPRVPDITNYFQDPSQLLYDPRRSLRVDFDHILRENLHRFPEDLRKNQYALRHAVEGTVKAATQRVRRNYKTAIPQFFQGKLQLLLPLCLTNPSQADLALVVSTEDEVYIASTVLPLDAAYNNARLIARPDREWLEP